MGPHGEDSPLGPVGWRSEMTLSAGRLATALCGSLLLLLLLLRGVKTR